MAARQSGGSGPKKAPKLTLKEKRDAKRAKAETGFLKPRKAR